MSATLGLYLSVEGKDLILSHILNLLQDLKSKKNIGFTQRLLNDFLNYLILHIEVFCLLVCTWCHRGQKRASGSLDQMTVTNHVDARN